MRGALLCNVKEKGRSFRLLIMKKGDAQSATPKVILQR